MTMIRKDEPTLHGGDYSILTYLDKDFKECEEVGAYYALVAEYIKPDTLVSETVVLLSAES